MSSRILAIGGSLLMAGGIYLAVKSTDQKADHIPNELESQPVVLKQLNDTGFHLPYGGTRFPALLVKENPGDDASVPMKISSVKVNVKVAGNIAATLYDITYCNELDRILDGQFCFPLGEGQTISYFAMEVDGKLREASVVEKAKGRITYEAVVRRKIDPALLEWTAGNNFKTRIYPIPARGCKRVVVGFEQELLAADSSYVYFQPLNFTEKVESFSVDARVLKQPAQPKKFDEQGLPIKFTNEGEDWVFIKEYSNYNSSKPLLFEVPSNRKTRNVFVEKGKEGSVFYLNVFPKIYNVEKQMPNKICLLWDASGSSEKRNLAAEKNILYAYLKKIKNVQVELVTFSNQVWSEKNIQITEGNISELEFELSRVIYDGGTQLGCLDLSKHSCDEFLLMSDGISNFGGDKIKTASVPVHAICSSPLSDYSLLKGISQSTGGSFINLQSADSASCLALLSSQQYQFISCEFDRGKIHDVYPSVPVPVKKNFALCGIIDNYSSDIILNFGIGNKILHTEKIAVYRDQKDYKGMIRKSWAQKKLNELDIFYERNENEITELGKEYGIVTRNTSLIILDRIEDYAEHKVVPKDPELKKQYYALMNAGINSWNVERKSHLDQVAADFTALKDWYNTDYKRAKLIGEKSVVVSDIHSITADSTRIVYVNPSITNGTATYSSMSSNSFSYSSSASTADVSEPQNLGWSSGTFKVEKESVSSSEGAIELSSWDPKTPYMSSIRNLSLDMSYKTYLNLKKKYSAQPSYFVDVADYFISKGDNKTAVRILSNIAEMELENYQLLRILARRLQQIKETTLAISIYEKVLKIREEEPQSYRDLGLAYADDKQYQKAIDNLCKVVNRKWDGRFPQVEAFAAIEINNIISIANVPLQLDSFDVRLRKSMPCDVRLVINWDTDNCDMDLWVTDPAEEKCMYSNPLTSSGGRISRDFTGGYGPETFMIKKAEKGNYKVQVNYFGTRNEGLTGPTTVQADLYTNWGRSNQKKKSVTLRLDGKSDVVDLASVVF